MKAKQILSKAVKSYAIDSGNTEITQTTADNVAEIVYDRLLFRMEQLGLFRIKDKAITADSIKIIIRHIVTIPLNFQETVNLTDTLMEELYAED
jgi:hypothetical protein